MDGKLDDTMGLLLIFLHMIIVLCLVEESPYS